MTPRFRALLFAAALAGSPGCRPAQQPAAPPAHATPIAVEIHTPAPRPTLPPADAARVQPPVKPLGEAPPRTKVRARATIAAVGDVLLHDGVQKCAAANATPINCEGYDELYRHVSQYIAAADLTFANLEVPITEKAPNGTGPFTFNGPPASVRALKRAGVDVVSFSNNHVYDQGRRGFVESMKHLDAIGMPFAGAGMTRDLAWQPVVFEIDAAGSTMTVAFFAFTELLNSPERDEAPDDEPHVAIFDVKRAERVVGEAAKKYDAVIVSAHWGAEYVSKPGRYQVDKAHRMIRAGAIAVLGHHPHVLQPIEMYRPRAWDREGVIAYSLGNFISNQGAAFSPSYDNGMGPRREGMLLRIELVRRDYGGGITRVEIEGVDALPLWTENNLVEAKRDKTGRTKPSITVVALDRAIANAQRELAKIPVATTPELARRVRELEGWHSLFLRRKESIRSVVGERFIRELPLPAPQTPQPPEDPLPAAATAIAAPR